MDRRLLVTTGNGMFGRALVEELLGDDEVAVRAMVRDRGKFTLQAPNLEVVVGDMDKSETLAPALEGVTHVFLSSPIDERITARECAVIDASLAGDGPHVLKLHGAVRHDDELASLHGAVLDHLTSCGLPWTLISPNSVMETSLLSYAETLKWDCIMGMSGHGKVGLVALADVATATAAVVRSEGFEGRDCRLTGPAALDLYEVAAAFSDAFGRPIHYYDLPEDDFAALLLEHDATVTREQLEISVLCHLRAWRQGRAELVTDTVAELTGRPAATVRDWAAAHREQLDLPRHLSDKAMAKMVAMRYGRRGGADD